MLPGQENWAKVYETEIANHTVNPIWKAFKLSRAKLGNEGQKFKIECIHNSDNGAKKVIGQCTITFEQIKEENLKTFNLASQSNQASGTLKIVQFNVIEKPGFLDYIRGGTQLNLMIAVDFTASNGDPKQPTSLHYVGANGYNQYQSALYEVSEILLNYDYDKNIPMFGFGAKINNSNEATHCFPMNFNTQSCEVQGLQGIMQAYAYSLSNVKLSGPTYFGVIMEQAKQFAIKQQPFNIYTILLILTDGEIHDMDKTLEILASCSNLPISVIIIGVGEEKFEKMQILDGDEGLKSTGKQCRDLVQFVKFNNYKGNTPALAEEVLKELPFQLVEYMMIMGQLPKPPQIINTQNVGVI